MNKLVRNLQQPLAQIRRWTVLLASALLYIPPYVSNLCTSQPRWSEPRSHRSDIFSPVPNCHSLLGEKATEGQTATTIRVKASAWGKDHLLQAQSHSLKVIHQSCFMLDMGIWYLGILKNRFKPAIQMITQACLHPGKGNVRTQPSQSKIVLSNVLTLAMWCKVSI